MILLHHVSLGQIGQASAEDAAGGAGASLRRLFVITTTTKT